MLTLLIARHGNTFDSGDTLLRVGRHTDLPLSNSGKRQAEALGVFLQQKHPRVDAVYTSHLIRTQQTADLACTTLTPKPTRHRCEFLNEIDYGPDEGKAETWVKARLGEAALQQWEQQAIVPDGWLVDPPAIIQAWHDFAASLIKQHPADSCVLVVTSNGIARFAPHLLTDPDAFSPKQPLKMSTGAISHLTYSNNRWTLDAWNYRP
jgi:2,3-bisphosphoglycerate-dependent phosphoglycerate mutase